MIDYNEDWLFTSVFSLRGSCACRASMWAALPTLACSLLVWSTDFSSDLMPGIGLGSQWHGPFWSATTVSLAMLISFRTNQAWGRFWEGTSLLHQMRGEWFDSINCCVTFSRSAMESKPQEVKNFRHTLVRLMSLCHGSALEEISNDTITCDTIDTLGLDRRTLKYIKACKNVLNFSRVEVLLHLTQIVVTKGLEDNVLNIPPPILSRVYQTLSRGFVHCLNAKKIADTRFPFPWAQLLSMLLLVHMLMAPCVFALMIGNRFWAPLLTFVSTFAFFYLDLVAIELENPFGLDSNDLPLHFFQEEMNSCLIMLLHKDSDLVACCDMTRAETRVPQLMQSLGKRSRNMAVHKAKKEDDGLLLKPEKMNRRNARISDFVSRQTMIFGRGSLSSDSSHTRQTVVSSWADSRMLMDDDEDLGHMSMFGRDSTCSDSVGVKDGESIFAASLSPLPIDRSAAPDQPTPALSGLQPPSHRESCDSQVVPLPAEPAPSLRVQEEPTQADARAVNSELQTRVVPLCSPVEDIP